MKKHTGKELQELYTESDSCDRDIFAEMRTNLLLVAGEHYSKHTHALLSRSRNYQDLSEQQKLRLTKNHTQNITRKYSNMITASAPGVGFKPFNEKELSDQKSSELHHSVWVWGKERMNYDEKVDEWGDCFNSIGEIASKLFWDPNDGEIIAYKPKVDEMGNTVVNEQGQPEKGDPVYSGKFIIEPIYGFNLLRDPCAEDMKLSKYLIVRKMVDVKKLKDQYPQHDKQIRASSEKSMLVFDTQKGGYRKSQEECLVKEFYFRPCAQYPNGYFYYLVEDVILAEGELPGGIFPIVWQYCDKTPTHPRGYSPVRTIKPYQIEINRAASKIAEHQVTLGDDKLLIQNGTNISAGVALPGVRSINYSGTEPTILGGRDGSQYLTYMQAQIEELYKVMELPEEEDASSQLDPYVLLYRAASRKKRFRRYIQRFERFLVEFAKTYTALAKLYLPEQMLIQVVGKPEAVNIPEFKNAADSNYKVIVEAQSEDIETKFGTQIFMNQVLQYVGGKLDKNDIGKVIRNAPYGNFSESMQDLTMDYDSGTNLLLALDRGEQPLLSKYDDAAYMVKRMVARMRQSDFRLLPPETQNLYMQVKQLYEQWGAEQLQAIQRMQQGFIPTDGYLVTCDFYVSDPMDPTKTKRVRLPYSSIQWLIKQLEAQGQGLDVLQSMNQQVQAEVAQQMMGGQPPMGEMQSGGTAMPPNAMDFDKRGMESALDSTVRQSSAGMGQSQPMPM